MDIRDENNKHKLIVDKASASVVRRIFDLCESGIGNVLITKELNEKNVLTPSEYNCKILKITSSSSKVAKQWTASIVGKILDNRVYCGDMVQKKQAKVSYKSKKKITLPENIKYIGDQLFYHCVSLETVYFPQSILSIESIDHLILQ